MELRQLKHFIAVAETHNFGQAARRVNLSQPALTRSIKTLEADLRVKLLERGPKGAFPTPAGERFLEYARLIVSDCQRAREGLQADSLALTGRVSFGVAALFGGWITDEVVTRVSREHAGIRLQVTEGCYEDMLEGLAEGRLDFALTNIPAGTAGRDIVAEPLLTLEAAVVCGATHPLANRPFIRAGELAASDWAIISHPHSVDLFRQYFVGQGVSPPPFVATNSLALLRSLVVGGSHLSMVCEPVLHRELRRGIAKSLRVDKPLGQRRAGLLYLRRAQRPSAIERVMRIVRECCAEESALAPQRATPEPALQRIFGALAQEARFAMTDAPVTPAASSVPL